MTIKSPDVLGAWACSACHEYVDRVRRFAASKGIHIPEPGEYVAEEAA